MHILPETARSFVSDAYCKARHFLGQADDLLLKGAAVYKVATPLVAAGMDAFAGDETKAVAKTTKKAIDRGLVTYAKARKAGKAAGRVADLVM